MLVFWIIVLSILTLTLLVHNWTKYLNWFVSKPKQTLKAKYGETEIIRSKL
jgi:hypothetical protein